MKRLPLQLLNIVELQEPTKITKKKYFNNGSHINDLVTSTNTRFSRNTCISKYWL